MNRTTLTTVADELRTQLGDDYAVTVYDEEIVVHHGQGGPYINIGQPYADTDEFSVELAPATDDPARRIDDVPFDGDEEDWLDELVERLADAITSALPLVP